jgi:carbon storage regulator
MLVLSRKTQESIVVGGTDRFERMIKITVLDIKGGKIRLGIEADEDVTVHRSEVWERIVASDLLGGETAILVAPRV